MGRDIPRNTWSTAIIIRKTNGSLVSGREEGRLLAGLHPKGSDRMIAMEPAECSLHYAEEHIFERVSVCRDHGVLTEALRHGRGRITHDELKGSLALQESVGQLLRNETDIATNASLKRERQMIDSINRGIGGFERVGGDRRFIVSDRLNPEQKHVVEFVLNSRDRAVNIAGAAGTGKTATLRELHRGLREADRKVVAIAPTVSAVEELQKVGLRMQ
jgi:primosomal protein N'